MIAKHKYQEQIALHEKCLAILNMKIEAMRRLEHAEDALYDYIHAKDRYAPIRLFNTNERLEAKIANYKAIIPRINSYYAKYATKVCMTMNGVEEYDQRVQRIPVFGEVERLSYVEPVDYNLTEQKAPL